MEASQWVTAASAAISALATGILVYITFRYASTSADMLAEMKRSRDLAVQPLLSAVLQPNPTGHPAEIRCVVVRNLGNAPALQILFDLSLRVDGSHVAELACSVRDLGVGEEFIISAGEHLYGQPGVDRLFQLANQARPNASLSAFVGLRYSNALHVAYERRFEMFYDPGALPPWDVAQEWIKATPWDPSKATQGEPKD